MLVVDDDPEVREPLSTALREQGLIVHTATDGANAFQILASIPTPSVIALDLMMPVMDGWQFLRAISDAEFRTQIPVIALSGVTYRGAPGAITVLPKPVNMSVLLQSIEAVCVRRNDPAPHR